MKVFRLTVRVTKLEEIEVIAENEGKALEQGNYWHGDFEEVRPVEAEYLGEEEEFYRYDKEV